jgi:hypothetical protein
LKKKFKKSEQVSVYIDREVFMNDTVQTTINVELNRYLIMVSLARERGISLSRLIRDSLNLLADDIQKGDFEESPRKRQAPAEDWTLLHFTMSKSEYDAFLDLQKHAMCFFSLLVAIAIDNYAEKIPVGGFPTDSYRLHSFKKSFIVYNNYPVYFFCWEKMPKKKKNKEIKLE